MPATYLKVLLQEARTGGLPVARLLSGTGLPRGEPILSNEPVTLADVLTVLSNYERLMGPGWHLPLASLLTAPAHGPLGFAVVTAPDIRSSVNVLLRYIGTRAPFVWLAGSVEKERFVFRFYEAADLGDQRRTLIELAAVSLQSMLERPLGREITGATLTLDYAAPSYHDTLKQVFHADLSFSGEQKSLSFPAAWLDEPCALHDEAMHRYLVNRCEEELLLSAGALPAEIAVRQALLARPGVFPGLAEVAASQHVSPRTLIRRLERGNTSYQQILDDVRRTLAQDFLLNSAMTVASISWRLGYQDPSNFGRAFRRWYGMSPRQFRESASVARSASGTE